MRRAGLFLSLALLGLAAAALPLVAAAAAPERYAAKTAQGFPLRARVQGGHVWLVRVKVKLRCGDGGLLYDDLSDFEASRLLRNGRFSDLQIGPTDKVRWRGRLGGRSLRGSIRVEDRLPNGVKCDSGQVGFAAKTAS